MYWIQVHGLDQHWSDSRVDAKLMAQNHLVVDTKNIRQLQLKSPLKERTYFPKGFEVVIDSQSLVLAEKHENLLLLKTGGKWQIIKNFKKQLSKKPGLQGPMDDAFVEPFLVVAPSGISPNLMVQRWVDFELERLKKGGKPSFEATFPSNLIRMSTQRTFKNTTLLFLGTLGPIP